MLTCNDQSWQRVQADLGLASRLRPAWHDLRRLQEQRLMYYGSAISDAEDNTHWLPPLKHASGQSLGLNRHLATYGFKDCFEIL